MPPSVVAGRPSHGSSAPVPERPHPGTGSKYLPHSTMIIATGASMCGVGADPPRDGLPFVSRLFRPALRSLNATPNVGKRASSPCRGPGGGLNPRSRDAQIQKRRRDADPCHETDPFSSPTAVIRPVDRAFKAWTRSTHRCYITAAAPAIWSRSFHFAQKTLDVPLFVRTCEANAP